MQKRRQLDRFPKRLRTRGALRTISSVLFFARSTEAFSPRCAFVTRKPCHAKSTSRRFIFAPKGSGYFRPEDEESVLPKTYEPMMEYPGTMRPGRTPENMPFHDLPIGDNDPDPVPWPHFQQIEWHHQWDPPHEHPIPMEDFIEMHGRWATPEMEAAMRAGVRRDVRDRREQAEADKRDMIITDDDEDDDIADIENDPISLGDGMFGKLGSDADRLETAAATAAPKKGEIVDDADEDEDDGALDDFLLDLGLDAELDDDSDSLDDKKSSSKKSSTKKDDDLDLDAALGFTNDEDDDDDDESSVVKSNRGTTAMINVDDDSDLEFGLDDDDDIDDGVDTVPLDDFNDSENLDTEDVFDDGGFDFDDGDGGGDGGDSW